MVAQGDVRSPGQLNGGVGVSRDAPVFRAAEDPDPGFSFRNRPQGFPRFRPGAGPVVQDGFPVPVRLRLQAVRQFPQENGFRIIDGNRHADQPRGGLVFPLPLQLRPVRAFLFPLPVPGAEELLSRLLPQPSQGVSRPVHLRVLLQSDPFVHLFAFFVPIWGNFPPNFKLFPPKLLTNS